MGHGPSHVEGRGQGDVHTDWLALGHMMHLPMSNHTGGGSQVSNISAREQKGGENPRRPQSRALGRGKSAPPPFLSPACTNGALTAISVVEMDQLFS